MIALITPTGARPKQIRLCAEFMKRQDYQEEVFWVIVDDCIPVTTNDITDNFKENWTICKIYPKDKWKPGQNTQAKNLLRGIEVVQKYLSIKTLFIIEDDDYYSPQYLRVMVEKIKGYDVAGQQRTVYYDPIHRSYFQNGNMLHASLFQVAFTAEIIPIFIRTCNLGKTFIDMNFFRAVKGKKINLFGGFDLAVGMKGLPGRAGIGSGHRMELKMTPDPNMSQLKQLIGEDYKYYE